MSYILSILGSVALLYPFDLGNVVRGLLPAVDVVDLAISVQVLFNVVMILGFLFVFYEQRQTNILLTERLAAKERVEAVATSAPPVHSDLINSLQSEILNLKQGLEEAFAIMVSGFEAASLPDPRVLLCAACASCAMRPMPPRNTLLIDPSDVDSGPQVFNLSPSLGPSPIPESPAVTFDVTSSLGTFELSPSLVASPMPAFAPLVPEVLTVLEPEVKLAFVNQDVQTIVPATALTAVDGPFTAGLSLGDTCEAAKLIEVAEIQTKAVVVKNFISDLEGGGSGDEEGKISFVMKRADSEITQSSFGLPGYTPERRLSSGFSDFGDVVAPPPEVFVPPELPLSSDPRIRRLRIETAPLRLFKDPPPRPFAPDVKFNYAPPGFAINSSPFAASTAPQPPAPRCRPRPSVQPVAAVTSNPFARV